MASNRLGNASMISMARMIRLSTGPRIKAATSPSAMPADSDRVTTIIPIISEYRAPWMMRDSISRPTASVPSGNAREPPSSQKGGCSRWSRYCSIGEYGAIKSAKIASSATVTITASPATAPLFSLK